MPRLMLIRHGQTAWNKESRCQGQTDVSLDDLGLRQAQALAERLAEENIDAIYSSNLQRAVQTADAIADSKDLLIRKEPGLRETNFGDWEGMTTQEIDNQFGNAWTAWKENPDLSPPQGGETPSQVSLRVEEVLKRILKEHAEETIVCVCHGGSARILLSLALDLPHGSYRHFYLNNCSLSEIYINGGSATLTLLNDTCHLKHLHPG